MEVTFGKKVAARVRRCRVVVVRRRLSETDDGSQERLSEVDQR